MLLSVSLLDAQSPGSSTRGTETWVIAMQSGQESLMPLVRAIYSELAISVRFEILPSERALSEANAGRFDGELGRIPGVLGLYPNLVQTQENLVTIRLQAWVGRGATRTLNPSGDLALLRVGSVIGSKISDQYLENKGWAVTKVPTHDALARLLASGRVDVAIISTASQNTEVRTVGTLALDNLAASETYHVLNRRHEGIIPTFDAALKELKRDGRYQRLLEGP